MSKKLSRLVTVSEDTDKLMTARKDAWPERFALPLKQQDRD
jgi:hypothetical protein